MQLLRHFQIDNKIAIETRRLSESLIKRAISKMLRAMIADASRWRDVALKAMPFATSQR